MAENVTSLPDPMSRKIKRHLKKYKKYYIAGGVGVAVGVAGTIYVSKKLPKKSDLDGFRGVREINGGDMAIIVNPHDRFYAFGKDADVRMLMNQTEADAYNRVTEAFMQASVGMDPKAPVSAIRLEADKPDIDVFNRVGKLINAAIAKNGPVQMGTDYDYLMEV